MRFALLLFAACTTTHGPLAIDAAPPRIDAGPETSADASGAADADPAPAPDAGAAGCTSPVRGYAEIAHEPGEEPDDQDNAVAVFWDARTGCEPEVAGACSFKPCGTTTSRMAAGTVELYGSVGEHTLRHDERQGLYYAVADFEEAWTPGATVAVRASGAEFPAFDLAVTIPPVLELTMPPPAEITGALEIAWTPASGPDVGVSIISDDGPTISCSFPSAAGEGEVPGALLARLGTVHAHVMVTVASEVEQCEPSHRVTVAAVYRAFQAWMDIDVAE